MLCCHWSVVECCLENCHWTKRPVFLRAKNQWAKCVAWEPEQGSDPETGGLVGVPIPFLQIWKNQLFTWWATVTLHHVLFGTQFSKEVWSWTKACSKLSLLCFPLVFASLLSTRKRFFFSPELCAKRSQVCQFLQNHCNKGTNSWENSDLTSAHMVLCLEVKKKAFQKKGRAVNTDKEFLDMLKSSHLDEKQCARSA